MEKPFAINYRPKSISFTEGFRGPKGDVGYIMVVDKEKAIGILKSLIHEGCNITEAILGLDGDFVENNTIIYDGDFHEYDSWASSSWAEPILLVRYKNKPSEAYACWKKDE